MENIKVLFIYHQINIKFDNLNKGVSYFFHLDFFDFLFKFYFFCLALNCSEKLNFFINYFFQFYIFRMVDTVLNMCKELVFEIPKYLGVQKGE